MSQIIKDVRCIDGFLHNVLVDIDCVNNIIGEETLVDLGINCYCSGSSGSGSGESGNNSGSSGPPPICDGGLQVFNSVFVYETSPGIYEGTYIDDFDTGCFSVGDTVILYSPDAPGNPQPGDWIITTSTSLLSNEYWICTDTPNFLTNINLPDGANFAQSGGCSPPDVSVKCVPKEDCLCGIVLNKLYVTLTTDCPDITSPATLEFVANYFDTNGCPIGWGGETAQSAYHYPCNSDGDGDVFQIRIACNGPSGFAWSDSVQQVGGAITVESLDPFLASFSYEVPTGSCCVGYTINFTITE